MPSTRGTWIWALAVLGLGWGWWAAPVPRGPSVFSTLLLEPNSLCPAEDFEVWGLSLGRAVG